MQLLQDVMTSSTYDRLQKMPISSRIHLVTYYPLEKIVNRCFLELFFMEVKKSVTNVYYKYISYL